MEILLIESAPNALHKLLEEIKCRLTHVSTLKEAYALLGKRTFDLIITDLYLNDSKGLETLVELQKKAEKIPIIVVGDQNDERQAIRLGAQDYLPKGAITQDILERALEHAIERQRLHESLKALSFTDELTGLYNRRGVLTFLEQQIALSSRTKRGFYLLLIDLDQLKQINDSYGHPIGDRALIAAARSLIRSFRHHDVIGRIGGDEFAVIAINASPESGEYLKQHLEDHVKKYNEGHKEPFTLSLSIGLTYFDGAKPLSLEELMDRADIELYKAKKMRF